jgi:hypothetical protein
MAIPGWRGTGPLQAILWGGFGIGYQDDATSSDPSTQYSQSWFLGPVHSPRAPLLLVGIEDRRQAELLDGEVLNPMGLAANPTSA